MPESFPRLNARTRRFTLGTPRSFTVSPDGSCVLFLRSGSGTTAATALHRLDLATGKVVTVADPVTAQGGGEVPAEEKARRERRRETAAGIVSYSVDKAFAKACFVLEGRLYVLDLDAGEEDLRPLHVPGPVYDPRLSPGGTRVAWCRNNELWSAAVDGSEVRCLAGDDDPLVTWGQAEFVALEEMHRFEGFWWLDEDRMLAERVDNHPVEEWWLADPAHPSAAPRAVRYPAAGTADAATSLHLIGSAGIEEVAWDQESYPYLLAVSAGLPGTLLAVERRDHKARALLEVDVETKAIVELEVERDACWVDAPTGVPSRAQDGRVLWGGILGGDYGLRLGGERITPEGLQVRGVVEAGKEVVFTAWVDPTTTALFRWSEGQLTRLEVGGTVTAAAAAGGTVVVSAATMDRAGSTTGVYDRSGREVARIPSLAANPPLTPRVELLELGPERLRVGVLLPPGHTPGTPLPVLMHPYGGPGAQYVVAAHNMWLEHQWWAEQGFAVVVCDGRGTPGRGPAWERKVYLDVASGVLEDQVSALHQAKERFPDLDLSRVAMSGWSFGGYLSALAVLRRPDVFAAAVAGAPVTEWRLYDTFYTERFLGHPDTHPEAYDRSSLLSGASELSRPLMLIHGMVDDNVVVAHTLQLSQRLMEAGRAHTVLPLTGITHMASSEEVAENLLLLQARFLKESLGIAS